MQESRENISDGLKALRSEILCKSYKQRLVVNNVSVDVNQGEVVGLLGPNGAGKTTTFFMIVGMIKPSSGRVFLDNVEITDVPMYGRARMGIGYLSQEASVFRKMTVQDNILAILELMDLTKQERQERSQQLMEDFGISHIAKSKGYMIACTLCKKQRVHAIRR